MQRRESEREESDIGDLFLHVFDFQFSRFDLFLQFFDLVIQDEFEFLQLLILSLQLVDSFFLQRDA